MDDDNAGISTITALSAVLHLLGSHAILGIERDTIRMRWDTSAAAEVVR